MRPCVLVHTQWNVIGQWWCRSEPLLWYICCDTFISTNFFLFYILRCFVHTFCSELNMITIYIKWISMRFAVHTHGKWRICWMACIMTLPHINKMHETMKYRQCFMYWNIYAVRNFCHVFSQNITFEWSQREKTDLQLFIRLLKRMQNFMSNVYTGHVDFGLILSVFHFWIKMSSTNSTIHYYYYLPAKISCDYDVRWWSKQLEFWHLCLCIRFVLRTHT